MHTNTWHEMVYQCEQRGQGYVLVTVIATAGSTPRNGGTKMVVTGDSQFDTIGGGNLEFEAVKQAREMLAKGVECQEIVSYPLSSKVGQCCGGAVKLLFEVMLSHQQHIAIFGAGHVAQALVPILAQLPLQILWIEGRENWLEKSSDSDLHQQTANNVAANAQQIASDYSNVKSVNNDAPVDEIAALPTDCWIVILTHNHQLDYELVEASLKRTHSNYIGMIGSKTKAKRFRHKLAHRGFDQQQIDRLISPIGDLNITGKRPIEVAVSISSQIMSLINKDAEKSTSEQVSSFKSPSVEDMVDGKNNILKGKIS